MARDIGTLVKKILSIEELPSQSDCIAVMEHLETKENGSWLKFCKDSGIYLIVHDTLVNGLYKLISGLAHKITVEIGAGNGKLTYLLNQRGLKVIATDDYRWEGIQRPEFVEMLTHIEALQKYDPDLVIGCFLASNQIVPVDVLRYPTVRYLIQLGNAGVDRDSREDIEEMKNVIKRSLRKKIAAYPTFEDVVGLDRSHSALYEKRLSM